METKRDLEAMEARRSAGPRVLNRKVAQPEVARELGVSRQTASVCASQQQPRLRIVCGLMSSAAR
jgi:hypothetical protein